MSVWDDLKNVVQNTWNEIQSNNQKFSSTIGSITGYTQTSSLLNEMVSNPKVLAERILHKQALSGTLTIPVRNYNDMGATGYLATIPFFMSGDFVFSMGNQWENLLDVSQLAELAKFINQAHSTIGHGEANVSMQSEAMSTQIWKGSTFDGFNIDCLFVCTNRKINTLKILNILTATCLPTKLAQQPTAGGAGIANAKTVIKGAADLVGTALNGMIGGLSGDGNNFDPSGAQNAVSNGAKGFKDYIDDMGMIAPLNYGLQKGDEGTAAVENPLPNSTVTLQIGNYFRADNLVVESLSGVTLSKEIIAPPVSNKQRGSDLYDNSKQGSDYGFPLYLKCSIKLKPHSMMHFSKWQGYFLQGRHAFPSIGGLELP